MATNFLSGRGDFRRNRLILGFMSLIVGYPNLTILFEFPQASADVFVLVPPLQNCLSAYLALVDDSGVFFDQVVIGNIF